jgi:hypothetical protein
VGEKIYMQYILPLVEFPLQIALSHLVASRWFPFYSKFTTTQKYEWLAWTSTVAFQTTFTFLYVVLEWAPLDIGFYFLGHIAYDTAFLIFYNEDLLMYIHHVVATGMCASMYLLGPAVAADVAAAAALLERSNILLGIVWLLNRAGYGKTYMVQFLGALALIAYISLRLYWFPMYLLYTASYRVAVLMSVFVPMNAVWSWNLVKYYYHIAFSKKSGGQRLE